MFVTLLLLLLVLSSVIYFKFMVPFLYWQRRNIPYIKPWTMFRKVFIGKESFADLIRTAYNEHPDKRFYGNYHFLQPSLFVRDLDLIKDITVKDFDHFMDHSDFTNDRADPILSLNLFSLKGEKWREMRSILTPVFTGRKMKSMFSLISETATSFTQHFLDRAEDVVIVEMKDIFTKYSNDVIANCALGIKCDSLVEEYNEFCQMAKYVARPTPLRLLKSILFGFFPKIFEFFRIPVLPNTICEFFLHLVQDAISLREKEGTVRPDLIHSLMGARKKRLKHNKTSVSETQNYAIEITDEVITAQALLLYIAGFMPPSTLMSFLAYEVAVRPDIQRKLQNEIDAAMTANNVNVSYEDVVKMTYLDQVVSEALRKYPPGYILNRICVKDYVIKPKKKYEKATLIEKGCLITIPVIALHHSPEFFPDPDKFDPDRFSDENKSKIIPGSYIPFGLGPRNCIGSKFGLLEMKVLMVNLLWKFDLVPVQKTVIPLQLAKTLILEAKGGVWLGFKRRR